MTLEFGSGELYKAVAARNGRQWESCQTLNALCARLESPPPHCRREAGGEEQQ